MAVDSVATKLEMQQHVFL